ncbi:hypothetical protein CROQUDRAFT_51535 [Cronartium quercuum f. sp. fusiforme G11]|uniref:non-specific serine/threonine protein kinase n=1 Tax=Cronartium quercuum f. sp. fusiforme G11 TaxID=708437 RepID=A0A9P6ND25_9BASI|nr:hypothetical protein CROQUDRAFT_51535 [Cronartium quercuum f. sp. fusiforme G11]
MPTGPSASRPHTSCQKSATSYREDELDFPTDQWADDETHESDSEIQSYEDKHYGATLGGEAYVQQRNQQQDISSDDESTDDRTDAELAAVALEIKDLEDSVPLLKTSYHLLDRLGEGTFSSVYKAIDLHHVLYDNSQWTSHEEVDDPFSTASSDAKNFPSTNTSSSSSPIIEEAIPSCSALSTGQSSFPVDPLLSPSVMNQDPFAALVGEQATNTFTETLQRHALECGKLPIAYKSRHSGWKKDRSNVYVALKRIYVTSSPQRIMNELELMTQLRDARFVAYLIQAIRHEDQVIAIMPYRKHQDFRDYYRTASLPTIRRYLFCLFSALQDTHAKGIIHRDIKPANFLFDVHTKVGVLCDFGLAEQFQSNDWHGKCLHSLPEPKLNDFHGQLLHRPRSTHEQKVEQWKKWMVKVNRCKANFVQRLGRPLKHEAEFKESHEFQNLHSKKPFDHEPEEEDLTNAQSEEWHQAWKPVHKTGGLWGGEIGKRKLHQTGDLFGQGFERIGFKRDDTRPGAKANRAGTRGFRAPEVLLKCPDQTGAIDIWSVGITLLCFLTRRFPFFNSNDDTEALMEIATVFGRNKLEKSAALHNRTLVSNIPEVNSPRFNSLHTLVRTLNPTLYEEQKIKLDTPANCNVDRWTSIIFQAHKTLSDAVEVRGENLDPYEEPWYAGSELWCLVDLLKKTLDLDCTQRITAYQALKHKFFVDFS